MSEVLGLPIIFFSCWRSNTTMNSIGRVMETRMSWMNAFVENCGVYETIMMTPGIQFNL